VQCYMLMVIEERMIGPAWLSAGSLVSKAALGGGEQNNLKREETKKRASEQEQTMLSAERRKSNLQLARFGHIQGVKYAHTTRSSRDREVKVR
jgi:hypothetical protein